MIDKLGLLIVGHAQAAQTTGWGSTLWNSLTVNTSGPSGTAEGTAQSIIGTVIQWILAVAAIIAFIYLVLSGIKYITAGGDAAKATEARTGIINAIIGIIVIVLAFFIMSFAIKAGTTISSGS